MPSIPKPYKKGSWWVTSVGGVQHRKLCPITDGIKRAKELLRDLLRPPEARPPEVPVEQTPPPPVPALAERSSWSVEEAVERFLLWKKTEKSAGTLVWYTEKLSGFLAQFAGRSLSSITPEDGLRFKNWLAKKKKWRKGKEEMEGVGTVTINSHIRACKTLFNWACKRSRCAESGISSNPWEEIGSVVGKEGRERIITDAEMEALLANCAISGVQDSDEDMRDILIVLRKTTLRPGELRLLRWEHIRWSSFQIVIELTAVKTRKRREVTLLDAVIERLQKRRKRLRERGKKCGESEFVFCRPGLDKDGVKTAGLGDEPVTSNSFSQRFRRVFLICVKKGLIEKEKNGERIVCYSTRHSRISELVREGHQQSVIMEEAGHKTPAVTLRYIHLTSKEVVDRIRGKDANKDTPR